MEMGFKEGIKGTKRVEDGTRGDWEGSRREGGAL